MVSFSSRLLRWLFLSTVLLILYLTLFPFDFVLSPIPSFAEFAAHIDKSSHDVLDFGLNILLFMPFGFLLVRQILAWHHRWRLLLFIGFYAGLLFSTGVEFVQDWMLLRHATVADVIANTTGSTVGAWLFVGKHNRLLRWVRAQIRWTQQRLRIKHYVMMWFVYCALLLVLTGTIRQAAVIDNWNTDYPLLLGNERTGDRAWQGYVADLFIADSALPSTAVAELFSGNGEVKTAVSQTTAYYSLTSAAGLIDSMNNLPPLIWHGAADSARFNQHGAVMTESQWLETQVPVTVFTDGVMTKSEFTIGVVAYPALTEQSGPARIVSISADPYFRDLTLGQEGADLIFRFRLPFSDENGRKPELIISDLFADGEPHHIVVTYDKTAVRFYIDQVNNQYTFLTSPTALLFWFFSPTEASQVRLNAFTPALFTGLYAVLWLLPTVGVALILLRRK